MEKYVSPPPAKLFCLGFFVLVIAEWLSEPLECSPDDGEKSTPNFIRQIVKIDLHL